MAGPSISTRGTDGRGTERIRDASEYIYSTLRMLPSAGEWSAPEWRVTDQYIMAWFLASSTPTTSPLMQMSYAVEQRGHAFPSTLGPFHVAVFNRIRKMTGGQKLTDLKVFMPKGLNVSNSRSGGNAAAANPLALFLKETDVTEAAWDTVKGAMISSARGKMGLVGRQVSSADASLTDRASTFWVRSRDILGHEKILSSSDKLVALVYTFIVSQYYHRRMIDPGLKENSDWLWAGWFVRTMFERKIRNILQTEDADWIWADHIPVAAEGIEPRADEPVLESYYSEQMKTFGPAKMDHIEKLSAGAKAIVSAVGRVPLTSVSEEVRAGITTLTNEFVAVRGILYLHETQCH
jgi:hypothetical protein